VQRGSQTLLPLLPLLSQFDYRPNSCWHYRIYTAQGGSLGTYICCVAYACPLCANVMSSTEREEHDISQHCKWRTNARSQTTGTENSVKFGRVVFEICSRTYRPADCNTPRPYRRRRNNSVMCPCCARGLCTGRRVVLKRLRRVSRRSSLSA